MTATNIFYNFVGFRYSPPLTQHVLRSTDRTSVASSVDMLDT